MEKNILLALMILVFCACASENQQKGLDVIAAHYNTKTSFSKGFKTNAGRTAKKFTIKVERSDMLDTMRTDLAASNIALMLYESFSEKERDTYDNIEVQMQGDSLKEGKSRYYEMPFLDDGLNQADIFTHFSDNLMDKNYDAIASTIIEKYRTTELATNLGRYMEGISKDHGGLVAYKRTNFGILTMADNEKLFHFSGLLYFSDGYIRPYAISTPMERNQDFITGYQLN